MRWFEVFSSVLKRKGYNVQFGEDGQTNWDGDETKISFADD